MITAFSPTNYNQRYSAQTTPFGAKKPEIKVGKILEDFAREIPTSTEKEIPKEAYPQLPARDIDRITLNLNQPESDGIIPANQRILKVTVGHRPKWGETEGTKNSTKLHIGTIDDIRTKLRTNPFVEALRTAVEKLSRDPGQD